ncbi:DUF835 domain-containing protein [Methanomassiliicoccus luminyensis]|uniref:DUF835 domain-containing protein n=1 Tax=Methanomassiliicoccus luminyensis TaxID=1080712 RepID=UPI000474CEE5|nr:DUF835 domain-containing protein [Methanomassiliicoccus luminyensis]
MSALFVPGPIKDEEQKLEPLSISMGISPIEFDYGRTYFINEKKMDKACRIVQDFLYSGSKVMCVTRMHPDLMQGRWPGKRVEALWLSERNGPNNVPPDQLGHIAQRVSSFLMGKKHGVVLIDGIEYLCAFNEFSRVQAFIEQVNDVVMASQAILIVPIDPRSLEPRYLARLQRFAEILG